MQQRVERSVVGAARATFFTATLAVLMFTWAAMAPAQDAPVDPPAPRIDDDAGKLLREAAAYAASLETFAFDYTIHVAVTGGGVEQIDDATFAFAVSRPNRAAIIGKTGMEGYTVVSDGKEIMIYVPELQAYTKEPAQATLADFPGLLHLSTRIPMGGISDVLFLDNFYDTLMTGVVSLSFVGEKEFDGKTCNVLRFVESEFDWELWLEASDTPRIYRIVPDASRQLSAINSGQPGHEIKMDVEIGFSNWKTGESVNPEVFTINPPDDARQVEQFGGEPGDGAAQE